MPASLNTQQHQGQEGERVASLVFAAVVDLVVFSVRRVFEFLHALAKATHEFWDLSAAKQQQNDQCNEEELSWTDGTHGVKIWDEVLKSKAVIDTPWA